MGNSKAEVSKLGEMQSDCEEHEHTRLQDIIVAMHPQRYRSMQVLTYDNKISSLAVLTGYQNSKITTFNT